MRLHERSIMKNTIDSKHETPSSRGDVFLHGITDAPNVGAQAAKFIMSRKHEPLVSQRICARVSRL